jgi:hypothetical protein
MPPPSRPVARIASGRGGKKGSPSGATARGVGFRSLTESIDTSTAMGKFLFHVFGALARYERTRSLGGQARHGRAKTSEGRFARPSFDFHAAALSALPCCSYSHTTRSAASNRRGVPCAGILSASSAGCFPRSPTVRSSSAAQHAGAQRAGKIVCCSAPFPIAWAWIRLISS